jgi:DNA polymerase elongation subunit (family B)
MITKEYKGREKYKTLNQIHTQVVQKKEERENWPVPPRSRVAFIVCKGSQKLYLRGETLEEVKKRNIPPDLVYYLQYQLYVPLRGNLIFHRHLFDYEYVFEGWMERLKCGQGALFIQS